MHSKKLIIQYAFVTAVVLIGIPFNMRMFHVGLNNAALIALAVGLSGIWLIQKIFARGKTRS
jgi:hypothetical protein